MWLDSGEIKPGDSIPGKVNEALSLADVVLVIWSRNASNSRWVGAELDVAITRLISNDDSVRVISVRLDDTELPPLLAPRSWLPLGEDDVNAVTRKIANLESPAGQAAALVPSWKQ